MPGRVFVRAEARGGMSSCDSEGARPSQRLPVVDGRARRLVPVVEKVLVRRNPGVARPDQAPRRRRRRRGGRRAASRRRVVFVVPLVVDKICISCDASFVCRNVLLMRRRPAASLGRLVRGFKLLLGRPGRLLGRLLCRGGRVSAGGVHGTDARQSLFFHADARVAVLVGGSVGHQTGLLAAARRPHGPAAAALESAHESRLGRAAGFLLPGVPDNVQLVAPGAALGDSGRGDVLRRRRRGRGDWGDCIGEVVHRRRRRRKSAHFLVQMLRRRLREALLLPPPELGVFFVEARGF
mmetsp:Transcript_31042/g.104517  ORF Transcript_31042/g.104517 Transcript_31042/m.104517 type:complete len:295 (+) Transcript_31042:77-961(+)